MITTKIVNDQTSIPTWLLVIGLKRRCLVALDEYNYYLQGKINIRFENEKEQRVLDFIDQRRNVIDERQVFG